MPGNDPDRVYEPNSEPWRQFVLALPDIKQISDRRGLPTPIFAPLLSGSGNFARPNEHLRYTMKWSRQALRAAKRQGFYTVSMESDFKAQGERGRHVNQWDGHPSAECHEIYARKIAMAARDNMKKGSIR